MNSDERKHMTEMLTAFDSLLDVMTIGVQLGAVTRAEYEEFLRRITIAVERSRHDVGFDTGSDTSSDLCGV